jgi:hypothetical protein
MVRPENERYFLADERMAVQKFCYCHAKNISKHVVYMVRGKDVRHISLQEIERKIMEP